MNFFSEMSLGANKFWLAVLVMLSSSLVQAKDEVYTSFFSSLAVSGYDAVAYFLDGKPAQGSKKFSTKYKGATWQFKSAENLALFKADPQAYAPQYGGYCAYAVSQGQTAKGDPKQWTIYQGKLYLNYDASVKKIWSKNKDKYIEQANKNWPKVLN